MKSFLEWLLEDSPVLEVPEGKSVMDMPLKHFAALVKKKGRKEIVRALTNLEVWFVKKRPELSNWAKQMKADLAAELDGDES